MIGWGCGAIQHASCQSGGFSAANAGEEGGEGCKEGVLANDANSTTDGDTSKPKQASLENFHESDLPPCIRMTSCGVRRNKFGKRSDIGRIWQEALHWPDSEMPIYAWTLRDANSRFHARSQQRPHFLSQILCWVGVVICLLYRFEHGN